VATSEEEEEEEEEAFREERRPALIYPEAPSEVGTDPGIAGRVL
jgi:hypothetical protein